jgi:hypothetical protein
MNKRSAISAVFLSCLLALLFTVGAVVASNTFVTEYGHCSQTGHVVGTATGTLRVFRENFSWNGGYVRDIQWYVQSATGDPTGFSWKITGDSGNYPDLDNELASGSIDINLSGSLPVIVGTGELGSLPAGEYWLLLFAEGATENNHYFTLYGSGSNCHTGYGYSRVIAGATEAFSENELWMNVYEDFVTPTATFTGGGGTPMPTLTPTITLTPTPILSIITTLESGAGVAIERTSTYGDRAIVIAICVLIVIMLVDVATRIIYAKRNN